MTAHQTFWRIGGDQSDCRWCSHPAVADWDTVGACGTHLYELLGVTVDALKEEIVEDAARSGLAKVAEVA